MHFSVLKKVLGVLAVMAAVSGSAAADDQSLVSGDKKVTIGGYSFWQFGQIVKGNDGLNGPIDHAWQSGVLAGFSLNVQPSEYLNLVISPEFLLNYPCLLYTSDAADDLLCVDLGG